MNNKSFPPATIMIVDDTPANLKLLQELLINKGYRSVAFPSGPAALAAAARQPPDLILLDIKMPEMDGFEVCLRLKADPKLRDIPVLFISALTDTEDKIKAFSLGGVDYITKPFQSEEVYARVSTQLHLRRLLQESERRHQVLIEELPDVIMRFDREGRHLFVSEKISAWGELPAARYLGRRHQELALNEAYCRFWQKALNEVFEQAEPLETEYTPAGLQPPVVHSLRIFPEYDARQKVTSVLAISRDITARKQAESLQAQLIQAQKLESIGRLAGGVAHDYNNMLGVISGTVEMALERVDTTQPIYFDLKDIQQAAARSITITRQLLAFARRQPINPRVLDLNGLVTETLNMLKRLVGENIKLHWHPADGLQPVKMDPGQLDQILVNLAVNARDAIADVGTVTVATRQVTLDDTARNGHAACRPGDYVALSFSDTGCGMDATTRAQVFEPFFTTKGQAGTGLGLATVYGIVQQNQGAIALHSEPAKGSTFTIYLPCCLDEAVSGPDAVMSSAAGNRETILLVEDEPALLNITCRMLESLNYQVLAAKTPTEALYLVADGATRIDLLLTDVVLPEMNGWDLARFLMNRYPHLKVLFLSGYSSTMFETLEGVGHAVQILEKPFSRQTLAERVRRVMGERAQVQGHNVAGGR